MKLLFPKFSSLFLSSSSLHMCLLCAGCDVCMNKHVIYTYIFIWCMYSDSPWWLCSSGSRSSSRRPRLRPHLPSTQRSLSPHPSHSGRQRAALSSNWPEHLNDRGRGQRVGWPFVRFGCQKPDGDTCQRGQAASLFGLRLDWTYTYRWAYIWHKEDKAKQQWTCQNMCFLWECRRLYSVNQSSGTGSVCKISSLRRLWSGWQCVLLLTEASSGGLEKGT